MRKGKADSPRTLVALSPHPSRRFPPLANDLGPHHASRRVLLAKQKQRLLRALLNWAADQREGANQWGAVEAASRVAGRLQVGRPRITLSVWRCWQGAQQGFVRGPGSDQ